MWKDDLKFGHVYERRALDFFKYENFSFNDTGAYDILLDKLVKIEVKADRLAYATGNLAVEYECRGKPSAISITEAQYHIFFVINRNADDDVYIIPTEHLKRMVKGCKIVYGGDRNESCMYLLPLSECNKYRYTPELLSGM
jgi:hypothetical protein